MDSLTSMNNAMVYIEEQLLMQILCIAQGVREDNRKPFHRTLYVLSIAIFGLAAIAFHLLRVEKTPLKDTSTAEVERANHLTNKGNRWYCQELYQSNQQQSRNYRPSKRHIALQTIGILAIRILRAGAAASVFYYPIYDSGNLSYDRLIFYTEHGKTRNHIRRKY